MEILASFEGALSEEILVSIFRALCAAAVLALSCSTLAQAVPEASEQADEAALIEAFLASLDPQSGLITLPGGIATLDLSEKFHYLNPENTRRLLEDAWGNPPGSANGVLGMVLPAQTSPLDEFGWGVIIGYVEDGHVSDEDAGSVDYDELLQSMKALAEAENEQRKAQGYEAVQLVGWAEPPHYDALGHKMFWAKNLSFENTPDNTLNYFVRVLGREGVLELNAVAGMNQLSQIRHDMKDVMAMTDFVEGHRYADFNKDTDKVAGYGLAALVAGGLAAKSGLFAKLAAVLIAGKKFIIIGVLALAGLLFKLLRKKS